LNANPAAKFMTQSLLNLVQNAWRVLKSFSAVCLTSEVFCGSVRAGDAFVWVAITDPPHTIFHFKDWMNLLKFIIVTVELVFAFHCVSRTLLLIRVLESTYPSGKDYMVHFKYMHMRGETNMAQSVANNSTTASMQETQKQQKKQAKRESKLRLEVEQARGDVQKAEQKIAKARVDFEVASARLRTLEEELARLQGDSQSK
jgi:hypothetical protein